MVAKETPKVEVRVEISDDGHVNFSVEVFGMKGQSCEDVTATLFTGKAVTNKEQESALFEHGKVIHKPEYHEQAGVRKRRTVTKQSSVHYTLTR